MNGGAGRLALVGVLGLGSCSDAASVPEGDGGGPHLVVLVYRLDVVGARLADGTRDFPQVEIDGRRLRLLLTRDGSVATMAFLAITGPPIFARYAPSASAAFSAT